VKEVAASRSGSVVGLDQQG